MVPIVRRAARVQDGHSPGEQCLFAALWAEAKEENRESKLITIGWDRMGRLANLRATNAAANCRCLIYKRAIDIVAPPDPATRKGTTYRIWSYQSVLQRRIEAGMEWYTKNRGVQFVRPLSEYPQACARWDKYHELLNDKRTVLEAETVPGKSTVSESRRDTVPVSEDAPHPILGRDSLKQLQRTVSIDRKVGDTTTCAGASSSHLNQSGVDAPATWHESLVEAFRTAGKPIPLKSQAERAYRLVAPDWDRFLAWLSTSVAFQRTQHPGGLPALIEMFRTAVGAQTEQSTTTSRPLLSRIGRRFDRIRQEEEGNAKSA
jgi:hypothetical protein